MIIKAPDKFKDYCEDRFSIFLGGSIEMGKAENWQKRLTDKLIDLFGDKILILNPRRDDWDSSWEQSMNNPQFFEQVSWELEAQEKADLNVYYFSPGTKSPITLLELGLFIKKSPVVFCPEGYWRKGNVDIICDRYDVLVYNFEEEWESVIISFVRLWMAP